MRSAQILSILLFALVFGSLAALAARVGLGRSPHDDELVTITLDRVEHTVTLPPDHNARATYGIEPVLHLRRRNESEIRRRLDFNTPKIQDAIQSTLARFHYTSLQRNESRDDLALELREAVNGVLGGELIEAVTVAKTAER